MSPARPSHAGRIAELRSLESDADEVSGPATFTRVDRMASRDEALPRSSFLILLALADRPRHGLGVVEEVENRTSGEVKLGPGTLYGTLRRLEERGHVAPAESPEGPDDDPRRRYWTMTADGREALRDEALRMKALVDAAMGKKVLGETA